MFGNGCCCSASAHMPDSGSMATTSYPAAAKALASRPVPAPTSMTTAGGGEQVGQPVPGDGRQHRFICSRKPGVVGIRRGGSWRRLEPCCRASSHCIRPGVRNPSGRLDGPQLLPEPSVEVGIDTWRTCAVRLGGPGASAPVMLHSSRWPVPLGYAGHCRRIQSGLPSPYVMVALSRCLGTEQV